MIAFKILKQSKKSNARLGILQTPHGVIQTPSLIPVATQAVVKTLSSDEVFATGTQAVIANTFHLHLRPGERVVKSGGGLHQFMHWDRPIMTDSGGFQVFSLGFGQDFGNGKLLRERSSEVIEQGRQPQHLKIADDGVLFRSPIDGHELFIGPKESMRIQESLGADIIFAFDECTSPIANHEYTRQSLRRTHAWAKDCIAAKKSTQALYGVVQGGKFKDLRQESARVIGALPFDGFGIGGEFGHSKRQMTAMIDWVIRELPASKPRHLLGIGHPDDFLPIIQSGVDTFDCTAPTHYGRRGIAFVSSELALSSPKGRIDLRQSKFLKDRTRLDARCDCMVCATYTRSYISHLFRAHEITGMKLLTFHNLYWFNATIARIREDIKQGKI